MKEQKSEQENKLKQEWEEWSEKCSECRNERKLSKYEKDKIDGNENFCPAYPGCGDYQKEVDIFFLTKNHGGGLVEGRFSELTDFDDFNGLEKEKLKHYMKNDPYDNFHSFLVRRLIEKIKLKDKSKTWYLTDIWKCFILDRTDEKKYPEITKKNIKDNMNESFKNCKEYLIKEIEILKPKVIVLFGGKVQDIYHGEIEDYLSAPKPIPIDSIFPGTRTADKWFGKSKKNPNLSHEDWLIEEILKI